MASSANKVFMVTAGQVSKPNLMPAVIKFGKLSNLSPKVIQQIVVEEGGLSYNEYPFSHDHLKISLEQAQKGAIWQFKEGQIDPEKFKTRLNTAIQNKEGKEIPTKDLQETWNLMSNISSSTINELTQLESLLKENNSRLIVLGSTNVWHREYEKSQMAANGLSNFPATYICSFEEGINSLNPTVLENLVSSKIKETPEIDSNATVYDLRSQKGSLLELVKKQIENEAKPVEPKALKFTLEELQPLNELTLDTIAPTPDNLNPNKPSNKPS